MDVADADFAIRRAAGEFARSAGDPDFAGAEDAEFADAFDPHDGRFAADEFFENSVAHGVALETLPGIGDDDGGLADGGRSGF